MNHYGRELRPTINTAHTQHTHTSPLLLMLMSQHGTRYTAFDRDREMARGGQGKQDGQMLMADK